MTIQVLQVPVPGGLELGIILLIFILLFGSSRIPELARSTGKALGEFKRGREETEERLKEEQESVNSEVE